MGRKEEEKNDCLGSSTRSGFLFVPPLLRLLSDHSSVSIVIIIIFLQLSFKWIPRLNDFIDQVHVKADPQKYFRRVRR